jgi:uncharacterized protein with von Willebrand factor type A (vWA) domain
MDKVRELVVTVRTPGGEVVKVAELKSSGQRRELSEQEFADLAAHGEEEGLVAALEEAYAAGAEDSNDGEGAEASLSILWDAAARLRVRSTVRRLVLARALTRMAAAAPQQKPKTAQRTSTARKGAANARGSHAEH